MKYNYSFPDTLGSKYKTLFGSENQNVLIFSAFVFLIPIILGHAQNFPMQLIVGSLVNALLAGSALYVSFKKSLPIILLPVIAALVSGVIFGPFTLFLVYLVPFIWIGNAIFVYAIKNLKVLNSMHYIPSVFAAALFKAGFLFATTFALITFGLVPEIMLVPMSVIQFATASIGGLLAGTTLLIK